MLRQPADEVKRRAEALLAKLPGLGGTVIEGESVSGGGSTPEQPIPTWLIALDVPKVAAVEKALRLDDPPVIARIVDDRLVLDLRTVFPEEEAQLAAALVAATR
jgi:L-seryl-tRNA(Ser) seleniumtransferase